MTNNLIAKELETLKEMEKFKFTAEMAKEYREKLNILTDYTDRYEYMRKFIPSIITLAYEELPIAKVEQHDEEIAQKAQEIYDYKLAWHYVIKRGKVGFEP